MMGWGKPRKGRGAWHAIAINYLRSHEEEKRDCASVRNRLTFCNRKDELGLVDSRDKLRPQSERHSSQRKGTEGNELSVNAS